MTYDEAKHRLLLHGPGATDGAGELVWAKDGFVCSLRPYEGLIEKNFHLVMEALFTVAERIHRTAEVDRELIHAVWMICATARVWGLHPDWNKLIAQDDALRLERWIDTIENLAIGFLGGHPPHYYVHKYAEYVTEVGWWDNFDYFVPLLQRAISDPHLSVIKTNVQALGKLGGRARASLPTLYQALALQYTYYFPIDRCTEEMHAVIRAAIQQIEAVPIPG